MRGNNALFVLSLMIAILLTGGLGFITREQCDKPKEDGTMRTIGEMMLCYHEAAISQAIACGRNRGCAGEAAGICERIPAIAGPGKISIGESQMNYCLQDVARYTKNPQICERITQQSSALEMLRGGDVSKEICRTAVDRSNSMDPDRYLRNPDRGNLCSLAFILLPLAYLAFIKRYNMFS